MHHFHHFFETDFKCGEVEEDGEKKAVQDVERRYALNVALEKLRKYPNHKDSIQLVVSELKNYKKYMNKHYNLGATTMHFAAAIRNRAIISYLLVSGAHKNKQDSLGNTPLHYAVTVDSIKSFIYLIDERVVKQLLENNAFADICNNLGQTPLMVLCSHPGCYGRDSILLSARELIRYGALVNETDKHGKTPLHFAVMVQNCKVIEFLLQSGAEVNKQEFRTESAPLHYAVTKQKINGVVFRTRERVVSLLLQYGADANLKDWLGNTAMHYASESDEVNFNIVHELYSYEGSFTTPSMSRYVYTKLQDFQYFPETKTKLVKLYLLDKKYSKEEKMRNIIASLKERNPALTSFLDSCAKEVKLMCHEKLAPNVLVYHIALCGAFYKFKRDGHHFSMQIYEKMLEKMLEGQYPIYSDLIVAGICTTYLCPKLRKEFCSYNVRSDFSRYGSNIGILCEMSSYLSHFDMLNMIKACQLERKVSKYPWYTPCLSSYKSCSVS